MVNRCEDLLRNDDDERDDDVDKDDDDDDDVDVLDVDAYADGTVLTATCEWLFEAERNMLTICANDLVKALDLSESMP